MRAITRETAGRSVAHGHCGSWQGVFLWGRRDRVVSAGGDHDGKPGPGGGLGRDRDHRGLVPGLPAYSVPGQVQRRQIRSLQAQLQQLLQ